MTQENKRILVLSERAINLWNDLQKLTKERAGVTPQKLFGRLVWAVENRIWNGEPDVPPLAQQNVQSKLIILSCDAGFDVL